MRYFTILRREVMAWRVAVDGAAPAWISNAIHRQDLNIIIPPEGLQHAKFMVCRGIPCEADVGDWLIYEQLAREFRVLSHDEFEKRYQPVAADSDERISQCFGFEQAIVALKQGKRVARAGWNGKGVWIALSGPLEGRSIHAESFWSEHGKAHALANGGYARVLPSVIMKTATGEILMGWLASQTDMLAEDWMEV